MRLIEDLFTRQAYNPLIRPVRNLTGTINVKFGMAMIQLINVVSEVSFISARFNIYISRLCHDASPSVRLSVCDRSALAHYS